MSLDRRYTLAALTKLVEAIDAKWTNRGSTPPKELLFALAEARIAISNAGIYKKKTEVVSYDSDGAVEN